MRTYKRTHPWIRFELDSRPFPTALWLLLGEAQSKCEHVAGVPLEPETARRLHRLYLAKGILATTAIEGNTLSEEEVLKHLEGKLKLPPSKQYLAKEIDNIVKACNLVAKEIAEGKPANLSLRRIKEFNRLVLEGLNYEPGITPGELRKHAVGVARYRGAPAEDCEYLVGQLCEWLNNLSFDFLPKSGLVPAILKAVLAHLFLAWIHPFGDGNGRTARLVELQILVNGGVSPPAAHLLSNHYNQTRTEYYRQLDYASRSGGDLIPFLKYAVQGFVDGLRSQIEVIREQHFMVAWENYVHAQFRDRTSPSNLRQLQLILDLSKHGKAFAKSDLARVSPEVAAQYARKTPKTLTRDVNALMKMGLIVREESLYKANREAILAFLPLKRAPSEVNPIAEPTADAAAAMGDPPMGEAAGSAAAEAKILTDPEAHEEDSAPAPIS